MEIERWDPFREAVSLRDALNSLVQESFIRPGSLLSQSGSTMLPLEVAESENEFVVKATLPGVKPEDVHVTIQNDTLTIRGERKADEEKKGEHWHVRECRYGTFQRLVSLPTAVDSEKARASCEHGILTLTLPKAEQSKPRQIKVGGPASVQVGHDKPQK